MLICAKFTSEVAKNKNPNIYFFIGTTAELIKLAPVIRELKSRKTPFKIIASNQNVLRFSELKGIFGKVEADYTFRMSTIKWLTDVYLKFIVWSVRSIGNYLLFFRREFNGRKNEILFVVHGDTITAFVGAVVAKLCRVKLLHIESGLRSHNFLEPFPEEINRYIVSWLSDVHFCPNKWSVDNLKNHSGVKVNTFGNTIGEATNIAIKDTKRLKLGLSQKQKYFILVLHRQEHTLFHKANTEAVIRQFLKQATKNIKCVFVMHHLTEDYLKKNKELQGLVKRNPNVVFPPRFEYLEFVNLIKNAEFIATDGGSNQEEAYYLGKPCLILRNHTERIEGLGENAILYRGDMKAIEKFVKSYKSYRRKKPVIKISPSKIIVDYLVK